MIRFLLRLPGVRHLHQRQLLFPVLVLLVVAGVLAHGALDRTRTARAARDAPDAAVVGAPDPPLPAASRPPLRGDLEKTPLTYFSDYWAQLASEVRAYVVPLGTTGHGGLVIAQGLAVTSTAAADAVTAAEARTRLALEAAATGAAGEAITAGEAGAADGAGGAGDSAAADGAGAADGADGAGAPDGEFVAVNTGPPERALPAVRAVDRAAGLALVEVAPHLQPFEMASARALPSGSYVGAVTLDASGAASITPGYLVSASAAGPAAAAGAAGAAGDDLVISAPPPWDAVAAVVDLDGALIGVTYRAPDGARTLSVDALRRVIGRMQRSERCRAIAVSALNTGVLELLATDGLLIEHVVAEAFVPEPSLRPGDVLLEWDGAPVTTVDDFHARYDALDAGALVRYRVVRGPRRVAGATVMPDADCRAEAPPLVRLVRLGLAARWAMTDASDGPGWIVTTVAPDGAADRAGIAEGDRLAAVDGRAAGGPGQRETLERLDARERPVLIAVRRDGRMKLAAVTPPE